MARLTGKQKRLISKIIVKQGGSKVSAGFILSQARLGGGSQRDIIERALKMASKNQDGGGRNSPAVQQYQQQMSKRAVPPERLS